MLGRRIVRLGWSMGLVLAGSSAIAMAAPVEHHGEILVRVHAWPQQVEALGLDVWTHHASTPSVVVRVVPSLRAGLDASGYDYEVIDPDLGARLEEEERARRLTVPPVSGGGLDPTYHDTYHELPKVLEWLDALVAVAPERVSLVEVGVSLEGRPIRGVRITNPSGNVHPSILVLGAQHAREWISPAAITFAAEQLATAVDGSAIDLLLDEVAVVMVPVVNPDGYAFSWSDDRLWRKNRRDEHGVDLNRNWSVAWGGEGSSDVPESGNYRGDAPFSEPETAAIRDFVEAEVRLLGLLDVHSYGQLVLWPWGFAEGVVADDDAELGALAVGVADAMMDPYDRFYEPMQASDFYPAAGNVADWAYGVHGLHALGVELRPGGDEEAGFLLSEAHIVPTGEELLAGILVTAETALELGSGSPGDDGDAEPPPPSDDTAGAPEDTGLDGMGDQGSGEGPGVTGASSSGDGAEPEGTGGGAVDQGAGTGCGCGSAAGGKGVAWWAFAALGLGLRRRRPRARS